MSVCQSCGACCASLRVDFHPAELAGGGVRLSLGRSTTAEAVEAAAAGLVRAARELRGEGG